MNRAPERRALALCLSVVGLLTFSAYGRAQQAAASTEMPSQPFQIKNIWNIGGSGSWDYLTLDAPAQRLYIAHGHTVQAVDISTGTVAGEITGLAEAHQVALDDTGELGYISDGPGSKIVVFDRRTLASVASIEDVPSPRALVYEPQTKFLFAVHNGQAPVPPPQPAPRTTTHIAPRPAAPPPAPVNPNASSFVTVIDTQTRKIVAEILLPGVLGFAQTDGRGKLFVNATDRNQILFIDTDAIPGLLAQHRESEQRQADADGSSQTEASASPKPTATSPNSGKLPARPAATGVATTDTPKAAAAIFTIDSTLGNYAEHREGTFRRFSVNGNCATPKSLAIDSAHERLFAACDNRKLLVLNAENGDIVASLPIGPGVDAIGYDPNHNLIYSANGGAEGTLTVISQSVTDSYAVIQTLPTRQRARTLAVNADTGQVYLVTDLLGVNLSAPASASGVRTDPVNGTFQVLVVGN
jgi:hypothetical protein